MCGFYFSTSACYCLSLPLPQFPRLFQASLPLFHILMLVPLFFLVVLLLLLLLLPLLSLGHFSEKCFQLLRVGSACCADLPLSFSSRLGSVHIKYVFPISVYLVFHFLFYVCQINNNGATAATTIKHSSRRERPQKVTTTANCSHWKCHRSAANRKRKIQRGSERETGRCCCSWRGMHWFLLGQLIGSICMLKEPVEIWLKCF